MIMTNGMSQKAKVGKFKVIYKLFDIEKVLRRKISHLT